jgi:glyoxylase-like metal-dependent hydrolase (beta-lactamase superfamily II)
MYIRQYQMSNFVVFSYLVGCQKTKEAAVIDPAGDVEIILDDAVKHNFRITKIINTHGHIDHIMGNSDLKKKTNAAIIIHEADALSDRAFFYKLYDAQPSPSPDVLVKDGDTISF